MTLSDIRSRLAGLEGRTYWRSLEELADTPEFREYVQREFPAQASEFTDPAGRRQFLKLMGASLALAGVSACTRQPDEKIVPYVRQPEEVIPGRPLFFATAMPHGGFGDAAARRKPHGPPDEARGQPRASGQPRRHRHLGQASVLSLYDPDRSRTVIGPRRSQDLERVPRRRSRRPSTSQQALEGPGPAHPDRADHVAVARRSDPDAARGAARGEVASVGSGLRRRPGRRARRRRRSTASTRPTSSSRSTRTSSASARARVRYTKDFSSRRRIGTPQDELNRLYVVEPVPTITGAKADHRLPLKARDVHAFAAALAAAVGAAGAGGGAALAGEAREVGPGDRRRSAGAPRPVGRRRRRPSARRRARARAAMNEALGNAGTTVSYAAPVVASPADGAASLAELVADMNARQGRRARDPRRQPGLHRAGGSRTSRPRSTRSRRASTSASTTTRPPSSATGTRRKRTTSSRGATCARSTARSR